MDWAGCGYDINGLEGNWKIKLSDGFRFLAAHRDLWTAGVLKLRGASTEPASLFVGDRQKVNEYCCSCLLPLGASGKMEEDHLALVSSLLMRKWIVRERSVRSGLCLDSSISSFTFPLARCIFARTRVFARLHASMATHGYGPVWSQHSLPIGYAWAIH